MSYAQLSEHLGYVTDPSKFRAYGAALEAVVRADSVVLDLGSGTGLLGLIAARCGARKVYAVDGGPIIRMAAEAAGLSGCADRIVHVRGYSRSIELPEPVDVVVCDQIGGFVHDAGILGYYDDAVARLLKPGGVLIPSSFVMSLTAVSGPELAAHVGDWYHGPEGLDFSVFAEVAMNTEHYVNAPVGCALGPSAPVATISSDHDAHFGGAVELAVEREGELCGLLGTFVARMSPGVTMTNAPWAENPMKRWQNFYPFAELTSVRPGDCVRATIDVSPRTGMVAWTGEVVRADCEVGPKFAHDTLKGMFAGPDAVIRASDAWAPPVSSRAGLAQEVIALVDGRRSIAEIAEQIRARHAEEFVSERHARSFVRSVLSPITDG